MKAIYDKKIVQRSQCSLFSSLFFCLLIQNRNKNKSYCIKIMNYQQYGNIRLWHKMKNKTNMVPILLKLNKK